MLGLKLNHVSKRGHRSLQYEYQEKAATNGLFSMQPYPYSAHVLTQMWS